MTLRRRDPRKIQDKLLKPKGDLCLRENYYGRNLFFIFYFLFFITRGFLCGTLDHDHQSIPSDLSNSDDSYIQTMAHWKIKYEMTCNRLHVQTIALHKFLKNMACNRSYM
jgi:hypothetical protein